jgi:hypothetical protein
VSVAIGLTLFGLVYVFCLWRLRGRDAEIEFCLLSVAMLACAGLNESHDFIFMIFPTVALCTRVVSNPSVARVAGFGLILLLLNHLGPWAAPCLDRHPYLRILANHSALYGLMMMGVFWGMESRRGASAI